MGPSADDHEVTRQRKSRLRPFDSNLRKFRYHDALDAALESRDPVVVVTVLEELIHRGGVLYPCGALNCILARSN